MPCFLLPVILALDMKKVISAVVIFLLIGILSLLSSHYSSSIDNTNINLSALADKKFETLDIPLSDELIHKEITANRFCNWSSVSYVYKTNKVIGDLCENILSHLSRKSWHPLPSITKNKILNCEKRSRSAAGTSPGYYYYAIAGRAKEAESILRFNAGFFPVESSPPYFMPIDDRHEHNVAKLAKNFHQSFYYIQLEITDPFKEIYYPCSESNFECKYPYTTYKKSIFSDGAVKVWSR